MGEGKTIAYSLLPGTYSNTGINTVLGYLYPPFILFSSISIRFVEYLQHYSIISPGDMIYNHPRVNVSIAAHRSVGRMLMNFMPLFFPPTHSNRRCRV